jgi:hypothetical protein
MTINSSLLSSISAPRLSSYLEAAKGNEAKALQLYAWNAKMAGSFNILLQAVEVTLRNKISEVLLTHFGKDWWKKQVFKSFVDRDRRRDLKILRMRIKQRKLTLDTNQMVASLPFGFWVGLLQQKYSKLFWSKHFASTFDQFPTSETLQSLHELGTKTIVFRSRIAHYDCLLKHDLKAEYADLCKMLSWLCPQTAKWVDANCDVLKLIGQKPV